jgi:16S rRNA (guanine966-N2)-methyltransferase
VAGERFDIVFADPPYGPGGWRERLLRHIGDGEVLAGGGLFVMEEAAVGDVAVPGGWQAADQRKYGETRLVLFRRS